MATPGSCDAAVPVPRTAGVHGPTRSRIQCNERPTCMGLGPWPWMLDRARIQQLQPRMHAPYVTAINGGRPRWIRIQIDRRPYGHAAARPAGAGGPAWCVAVTARHAGRPGSVGVGSVRTASLVRCSCALRGQRMPPIHYVLPATHCPASQHAGFGHI
jgi:hypothetical protein